MAQDNKWFKTREGGAALARFVVRRDEQRTIGEIHDFIDRLTAFLADR